MDEAKFMFMLKCVPSMSHIIVPEVDDLSKIEDNYMFLNVTFGFV